MGRAAYVVMSHKLPEQLVRLVGTLHALSPGAAIVLHHDARAVPLPEELREAPGVTVLDPIAVEWGRASQQRMLLAVLRGALAIPDVDWIFLLSGQDYPLRPLIEVEAELRAAPYDGYLDDRVIDPPTLRSRAVDEFAQRYFYAWRPGAGAGICPLPKAARAGRPLTAARTLPSGDVLLGRRRVRTPFTAARPCRVGPDWLTLSAPAARRLVDLDQTRDGRRLLGYYAATLAPTESLPHTVLWADRSLTLSNDVRRYTAWEPGAAHPRTLGTADFDAALRSGNDFARKFDLTVDPQVLDRLDAQLGLR